MEDFIWLINILIKTLIIYCATFGVGKIVNLKGEEYSAYYRHYPNLKAELRAPMQKLSLNDFVSHAINFSIEFIKYQLNNKQIKKEKAPQ